MNKFNLLYFGELDLVNLGEDYFTEIDFDGNMLDVHLNFESKTIDKTIMERINQRLTDIAALDALGKKQ